MSALNPFAIAQQQLDEAAVKLGLDAATHELLRWPMREYHFTIPVKALTASSFESGFGFDGSSIRGWQAINESDMLVVPQSGHLSTLEQPEAVNRALVDWITLA